jgi:SPP1 family predicted phage head-tail adaptor
MRAGKLRNKVVITNPAVTGKDAIGGETTTPATFADWWCELVQVSGGEVYKGRAVDAQATSVARGRYVAGVTRAMYIVMGSRTFDILNVNDVDERHRELMLDLKERGLA